jgi:3-oxoacyl-[acyl-carrier-protein] synthase II
LVSPLGSTVADTWSAVLRGESGIGPITRFDVSAFAVRFGGAVRGFNVEQYLPVKEARRMDDFMLYGVAAGVQAVADAGLDFDKLDRDRCGVLTGAGIGGLWTIEEVHGVYLNSGHNPRKITPFFVT